MRIRLVVAVLLLLPLRAGAVPDPLRGPDRFPQFRHLSGLAGAGYGTDEQGYPSLSGPTAFSTPTAYVLGHAHLRIAGARTSFDGLPRLGGARANGTWYATYGHSFGRVNVAISDMVLSSASDQVYNWQIGYVPEPETPVAFSIGMQDWAGTGGSAGQDVPGDNRSSQSVFGAATLRVPIGGSPLYVSGGVGSRRFHHGFASVSCQVAPPVRVWAEHDGFGFNTGALYSLRVGEGRRSAELNVLAGVVKMRFFTLAAGIGF